MDCLYVNIFSFSAFHWLWEKQNEKIYWSNLRFIGTSVDLEMGWSMNWQEWFCDMVFWDWTLKISGGAGKWKVGRSGKSRGNHLLLYLHPQFKNSRDKMIFACFFSSPFLTCSIFPGSLGNKQVRQDSFLFSVSFYNQIPDQNRKLVWNMLDMGFHEDVLSFRRQWLLLYI